MVLDVLRGYLQVANGLTDVTVARAREIAEAIVSSGTQLGSRSSDQVATLTDDLLESSRTNRDLLTGMIRTEVDRAVGRMGFVREEELAAVRSHVQRLEDQIRKEHQRAADRATGVVLSAADTSEQMARGAVGSAAKTVRDVAAKTAAVPGAKKAPARKATARKAPGKKTTATAQRTTTNRTTPAKRSVAKKTPRTKSAQ